MTHLAPGPHPTAVAYTTPHVEGRLIGADQVDARLVARLTPASDLDFVLGAVPVPGPAGPAGPPGEDGTAWFDGAGPPVEPLPDAMPGDYYLDTITGDVYVLTMTGPPPMVVRIVPGPTNKRIVPGG